MTSATAVRQNGSQKQFQWPIKQQGVSLNELCPLINRCKRFASCFTVVVEQRYIPRVAGRSGRREALHQLINLACRVTFVRLPGKESSGVVASISVLMKCTPISCSSDWLTIMHY